MASLLLLSLPRETERGRGRSYCCVENVEEESVLLSPLLTPENRGRIDVVLLHGSRRWGCHCRALPAPLHSMPRRWGTSHCRRSHSLEGHRRRLGEAREDEGRALLPMR
nr:hypothetical protein Itr_chr11CG16990 [Ipomoea trifida]GLL39814.1 hypothetical protein Itr_chr11CG17000 [Ipomoea trifida]